MGRRDDRDRQRVRLLGERVRSLREARGLTQEALAEAAGVHRAEVGFIERAEREIGVTLAWRLADGLGVPLAELVAGLD